MRLLLSALAAAACVTVGSGVDAAVLFVGTNPFTATFTANNISSTYGSVTTAPVAHIFVTDITTAVNATTGTLTVRDYLNTFDFVVFGNGTGGGGVTYDRDGWASLTTGILSIGAYQTRGDRLGWYSGGATDTNAASSVTETTVVSPAHPILAGVASPSDLYVNAASLQPSSIASPTSGTLVARVTNNAVTPADFASIIAFATGDTLFSGDIAAGRRVFFALNQNLVNNNDSLTASGQQALRNTFAYIAIPEPASVALLGLGGLLIASRRRA